MANKKITDATTATSVAGTDKVFLNQGGDLKQVNLNSAVANSQAVQTLNSNLDTKTLSIKTFSDGVDANTLPIGIYIVLDNVKNTPTTYGTLVILDTGFFSQLFLGTDGKFYTRQKVNLVWTNWIPR